MKQALLFITHKLNDIVISHFQRLSKSFSMFGESFMIINCDHIDFSVQEDYVYLCSNEDLNSLHYAAIGPNVVPGNNHFFLLHFFRNSTKFDYYWNVEFDVDFCGDWTELFLQFEDKKDDFISSHIMRYGSDPNWYWWSTLKGKDVGRISLYSRLRSFNPIFRISKEALFYIDSLLRNLNTGHHEVFIASVLHNAGFKISDLGGNGEFTSEELINKYYDMSHSVLSTMRHRPCVSLQERESSIGKLIHPYEILK